MEEIPRKSGHAKQHRERRALRIGVCIFWVVSVSLGSIRGDTLVGAQGFLEIRHRRSSLTLGLHYSSKRSRLRSCVRHRAAGIPRDPPDAKQEAAKSKQRRIKGNCPEADPDSSVTALCEDTVDPLTYVFGKPGELRRDLGMVGTTPEQILLAGCLAVVIGLISNLWGQTEFLLSVFPAAGQLAVDWHLDQVYAVNGLRGYYSDEYSLKYPREWLFDQRVTLAKFGQTDPSNSVFSSAKGPQPRRQISSILPDAAWGPAGGGDRPAKERENLSVVRQLLTSQPGSSPPLLEDILGPPEASLDKLLADRIAPEGSKKVAEPLRAEVKKAGNGLDDNTYYQYEWRTTFDARFALRSYSSVALGPLNAGSQRYLYTLTIVVPDDAAAEGRGVFPLIDRILESFTVSLR